MVPAFTCRCVGMVRHVPWRLSWLESAFADREIVIDWIDGTCFSRNHDVLTSLLALPVPDIVFLDAGLHVCLDRLHHTVAIIRDCAGDVPIIVCSSAALLRSDRLLAETGADALHFGNDRKSMLHLLGTFGFRLRRRRTTVNSVAPHSVEDIHS